MFERRLRILMFLLALPVVAVLVRLAQLQILCADHYRREARNMLSRRPRYFPCLRGDITDRLGRQLAYDAPAWDICLDYEIIEKDVELWAGPDDGRISFAERLRVFKEPNLLDPAWQMISNFSGVELSELLDRAARIRKQVRRIKELVSTRRGVETVVAEERMAHALVTGLTQEESVTARVQFASFAGVEIIADHVRRYSGGAAVGHLLGRQSEVDAEAIATDVLADDDLARYRPGSRRGVSGAERLGELWMRGRRGRIHEDAEGVALSPPAEPENGRPFRLTIDLALQQTLYNRLAAGVEATKFHTGGCAVVIHIPTRQVLAMVDYPSIDPAATSAERAEAIKDLARRPMLARAIREYYAPGSIVKPMILAAALADGVVHPHSQFTCYGRLFQDYPDRWRCTGHHGTIGPVFAIQHSCNVYFYHTGELLGVPRIQTWFSRFGLGRVSGTGLVGEMPGRLPDEISKGQARNSGIGQDFDLTPVQAANMVATIAAGSYRPVTLWLDDPEPKDAVDLHIQDRHWRVVREGMYKVVNESGGTAYGSHRGMIDDDRYVVLGKTGSAEVVRGRTVETKFFCHLPDGRVQEIVAPDKQTALAKVDCSDEDRDKIKITGWRSYRRYPPDPAEPYTHAWFIGYLAPKGNYLSAIHDGEAAVAIAVVVEYTGHGGEIASPIARDMLQSVLLNIRSEDHANRQEAGRGELLAQGVQP